MTGKLLCVAIYFLFFIAGVFPASIMLLGEQEEYGLPPKAEALKIIVNGRLAKSLGVFKDTGETSGADDHPKFTRVTLRRNRKFYE